MLLELNMPIRLTLLVLVSLLTVRYSSRCLNNGILLLLVSSLLPMYQGILILGGFLPQLTIERIVCVLVVVVAVLQWRKREIKRSPFDLIEYSMLTLLIVILLSMYLNDTLVANVRIDGFVTGDKLQLYGVFSGFLVPFMGYFILRRTVFSKAQAKSFLTGVGLITIYLGLTGIGEAFHLSWLVFPKYILDPNFGDHFGKVRGPFVQASWNGLAMAMGLPILLWLFVWRRDNRRWIWAVGALALVVVLPYVAQRAAWLSFAAALATVVVTWPKPRSQLKTQCALIGLVLLALPFAGLALPEQVKALIGYKLSDAGNIEYRYTLIESSTRIIADNLFTGIGFGKFNEEVVTMGLDENFTSHNTALTLFAELGLLGFLPYLFIFSCLFLESAKAYLLSPQLRVIIGLLWAITAAYIIMSMSVEMNLVLYPNLLLFALWGMFLPIIRQRYAAHRQHVLYLRQRPTALRQQPA